LEVDPFGSGATSIPAALLDAEAGKAVSVSICIGIVSRGHVPSDRLDRGSSIFVSICGISFGLVPFGPGHPVGHLSPRPSQ
jgi:hypothetical protein